MTGVNRFELVTQYFHYLSYTLALSMFIRVIFFQDDYNIVAIIFTVYFSGDVFSTKYNIKKIQYFVYIQKRSIFSSSGIKTTLKVATAVTAPATLGYAKFCMITGYYPYENAHYV